MKAEIRFFKTANCDLNCSKYRCSLQMYCGNDFLFTGINVSFRHFWVTLMRFCNSSLQQDNYKLPVVDPFTVLLLHINSFLIKFCSKANNNF